MKPRSRHQPCRLNLHSLSLALPLLPGDISTPGRYYKPRTQYERWTVPVLAPGQKSHFTAQVQMTWYPHLRAGH